MPTTIVGQNMTPPEPPLMTGNAQQDLDALFSYLHDLVSYLYTYQPVVEIP